MGPKGHLILIAASLLASAAAHAGDDEARTKLTFAIVAFGQRDLGRSKALLDEAQAAVESPKLLSAIHRQRGIVLDAEGRHGEAVAQLIHAIEAYPSISISKSEHGTPLHRLFTCARAMADLGVHPDAIMKKHADRFTSKDWTCPTAVPTPAPDTAKPAPWPTDSTPGGPATTEPPPVTSKPAPPPPPPSPTGEPNGARPELTSAPPPAADSEGGLLSSPIFWIAVGAVVAGSATATILLTTGRERIYEGSSGVVLRLSE